MATSIYIAAQFRVNVDCFIITLIGGAIAFHKKNAKVTSSAKRERNADAHVLPTCCFIGV
jgi:hypothetical protein